MVPGGDEALVLDAELGGAFLCEKVERDVVEHREVVGGVVLADARLVLVHRHIQHPMQAVLNGPVTTHDMREVAGVGGQAGDEETGLAGGVRAEGALGFDQDGRAQARPAVAVRQPGDVLRGPGASHLDATVVAVHGLGEGVREIAERAGAGSGEERLEVVVQQALVAFEAKAAELNNSTLLP